MTDLSATVFVLRLERGDLPFEPGQYIRIGPDPARMREYTVYSPPAAGHLEALVKVVAGGEVSGRLRRLARGDGVLVDGPYGIFRIPGAIRDARHLFIAAGTGIAPFHCFAQSYPGLVYTLLHGVRTEGELYHRERYPPDRHNPCLSRGEGPGFRGRVTDWLRAHPLPPGTYCHLCGGTPMIWECHDILRKQGIPAEAIHAEVYF